MAATSDAPQQTLMVPNVTVISAEAEVNSSYSCHKLVPGQFRLPLPYQRARQPEPLPSANSGPCERPAKRARRLKAGEGAADVCTTPALQHNQEHAQKAEAAAEATTAAIEVISRAQALVASMHLMSCHCGTCAQEVIEQQQNEDQHDMQAVANQHMSAEQRLIDRHQQLQPGEGQHQHQQQQEQAALPHQPQPQQQQQQQQQREQVQQQRKQQRQDRLEAGEDVDWVALASMAHILKPKLTVHDANGGSCSGKLFNTLHGNTNDAEMSALAHEAAVLLPGRSRFLMSDDRRMAPLLEDAQRHGGYHLLVLDPPWENASVRRGGQYATLPPKRLLELPVQALLHQGPGTLVALWMTNRPRQHRLALEQLLPAWGLTRVAVWWWLKVTCQGEPVSPLSSLHRHPYEQLWLARPLAKGAPAGKADAGGGPTPCCSTGAGSYAGEQQQQQQQDELRPLLLHEPPDDHVLVSVPGAHSVKPHLGRLLAPFVGAPEGEELRRCELFARGLAAGWTSWGNEVLALQGAHLFEHCQ